MQESPLGFAGGSGSAIVKHKKRVATGLALSLALILMTPAGAAEADCQTNGKTVTCSGNVTNSSTGAIIGPGSYPAGGANPAL